MPRYEQYKSKYRGVNYTKQIGQIRQIRNESKETNLKKPLIISGVFIVLAAVIFSIIRNYAPVVDIAIKDFFSINHQEALALESDGMEESADKLSFLNNIPLFNFFIKSDTNETLSVMAYETNSMLEASLSDNNLNNNNFANSINREALSPFFNDNYNSSIYRNNESQNNNENNNQSSENFAENNNSVNIVNNNERSYNYIEQMIIESRRNDNYLNSNNSANNSSNNSVNNNLNNSSAIRSESISQSSNLNSNSQGSSIFEEILKPKENMEKVVKTMKPASTSFSSTVPSYMQNDNNKNNDSDRKINNNGNNNYNSFFKDIEYNNGEPANNNQNNRERIINNSANNSSSISISKRENNNINSRKNIIEDTIFNNRNVSNPTDYERVVNDMVNPNISRDVYIDSSRDISRNISRTIYKNNDNASNIRNNNINNGNNTQTIKRDNKEEIMKKANEDVARYKRQKANNRINRDFNNIKMKSKDEGIYLVEYNENTGDITLIFRNRNFDISIENAIKTLLNGATDEENGRNIISCIPKNTRLLDIFVENDTVYLNFNEDFEFNPLGNEGTMIQIYQLVYTATQFEGIDKVIFLINGNLNETIGSEGAIENTAFTRFKR